MNKIQKISGCFVVIFNVLIVAIPLLDIISGIFIGTNIGSKVYSMGASYNMAGKMIDLSAIDWQPFLKTIWIISRLIDSLPSILGLFILKTIFKNYQKGEIFSTKNAISYKKIGWILFFNALLIKPLSGFLATLAITFHNAPGHRSLSIAFGTDNLESIFLGIIIIVISWVMVEASRLKDEQTLTI